MGDDPDLTQTMELLDLLRRHPMMFLTSSYSRLPTFFSLVDFLRGMDAQCRGALLRGWTEWLERRVGLGGPAWDRYVLMLTFPEMAMEAPEHSFATDRAAAEKAFHQTIDLLQEFLRERAAIGEAVMEDEYRQYLRQRYGTCGSTAT